MSKKNGSNAKNSWAIPILQVGSVLQPKEFAKSVELIGSKIEQHYQYLIDSNLLAERKRRKAAAELHEALWANILEPILNELNDHGKMEKMINQLVTRESDPYTLAEEVGRRYMKK